MVGMSTKHTSKMFATRIGLAFAFATIVVTAGHHLRKRSPDSMEVQMPSYSSDSNEDKMKDEGDYWQGEGDRMNERQEDAQEDRENKNEKNQEDFNKEKDYREEENDNNNKQAEEDYNEGKDRLESKQAENDEHNKEHDNDNDFEGKATESGEEFNREMGQKEDRYEEKGADGMNDRQEKMENYDAKEQGPSMSYNRD
ncbi:prostatic spermine-binding protein-like [Hyposmocoma kahamanoa]|uniref:prostatic spermine-binding protein-like n=1 Tax=Hyposmocoma kahamanoa TaxID=1477025 RepID=UPI000E6D7ADC|nr:prostatic spermine-binding protein-like [Hyposmocoma kahamanoa]